MNEVDSEAVLKAKGYDERPFIQNLALGAGLALQSKIGLQPDWDILDFGCGTGLVLQRTVDHVRAAVGVDSSGAMIQVLNEKAMKKVTACCLQLSLTSNLAQHYKQKSMSGAPDKFDLVYSSMTLHHIHDIPATAKLLKAYLKPGGVLVAFDLEKGPDSILFHPQPISSSVYHKGGFASEHLSSMWQEAGMKDVSCERVHRFTKDVKDDAGNDKKVVFWMLMVKGRS
ncbi:hypothetical protein ABBQ32_007772 [Trebouxia sp. C0010 RCD-2024]